MENIIRICPHVHFRDGEQNYKETIAHGLKLAEEQDIYAVFDMPNTSPPILTKKDVEKRLSLVPDKYKDRYFMWIGATSDKNQLREAVCAYDEIPQVIGIKLFAGKSTGDLAIIEKNNQKEVYNNLVEFNYTGPVANHCEKESLMNESLYDFKNPFSHTVARPEIAEVESGKDIFEIANSAGFKGIVHICHVSTSGLVNLIRKEKEKGNIRVTAGATPHHFMWTENKLNLEVGNLYKMNPPLRTNENRLKIIEGLNDGTIDWIETDHAPHSIYEKLHTNNPPSGYPSLGLYKEGLDYLIKECYFSQEKINQITSKNIFKVFDHKLFIF